MDLDPHFYPITILFSSNEYDSRGLEFYTHINKDRFQFDDTDIGNELPLNEVEKEFLCVKKGNDYYLKYDFLKFIEDVGNYHNTLRGIDNISDPVKKEIFSKFIIYPQIYDDSHDSYDNFPLIIRDFLDVKAKKIYSYEMFNIDDIDIYDIENNFNVNENMIANLFSSFSFEGIKGIEDEYGNPIIGNLNYRRPRVGNRIIILLRCYKIGLMKNNFNLNSFKPKNFMGPGWTYLNLMYKISNLILEYKRYTNLENSIKDKRVKEDNILRLDKYPFLTNFDKKNKYEDVLKFIPYNEQIIYGSLTIENNFYKLEIKDNFLTKINNFINKMNSYKAFDNEEINKLIDDCNYFFEKIELIFNFRKYNFLFSGLDDILDFLIENKENKSKINTSKINKISNLIYEMNTHFSRQFSTNYNKFLIKNKDELVTIDINEITNEYIKFKCSKKLDVNFESIFNLYLINIDADKCLNLGFNINNKFCSYDIFEVFLENDYGFHSRNFFRNDNNFKIHSTFKFFIRDLTLEESSTFLPDPDLILIILKKLGFRMKIIKIYGYDLVIIESYDDWKSNQKVDKELSTKKNLEQYLKYCIIYINVNVNILNPKIHSISSMAVFLNESKKDTVLKKGKKVKKDEYNIKYNIYNFNLDIDEEKIIEKLERNIINKILYEKDDKSEFIEKVVLQKGGNLISDNNFINKVYYKFKYNFKHLKESKKFLKRLKARKCLVERINKFKN